MAHLQVEVRIQRVNGEEIVVRRGASRRGGTAVAGAAAFESLQPLERASQLDVNVAGAESNMVITATQGNVAGSKSAPLGQTSV